jgi:lysozyme
MAAKRKKAQIQNLRPRKTSKKKKSNFSAASLFFIVLVLGGIGISYYYFTKISKSVLRTETIASIPEGFSSFGIDISHHQGKIDWQKLFVTERFGNNRKALREIGIPHGAYHFFNSKSKPRPQAKHFLMHWKPEEFDLPPVLDVESEGFSDADLIAKMKIWLEEVETATGMRPIIYCSLHYFETKFAADFKEYTFWIAAYSRKPKCIEDSRIIHWQYSETGALPGFSENVDFNVSKIQYN